ncbi:MAG: sterol desaturase family protein [Polyangiaceae bacterium]
MMDADASLDRAEIRKKNRDAARVRMLAEIPRFYVPWLHLAATTGIGVAMLVAGVLAIRGLRPVELLIVPLTILVSTGFEWRVHKKVLHKRRWPFTELYDRHTPDHHAVYHEEDMAIRSARELRLVLIPAVGVLGIVLATVPFAFVVGLVFGSNAGWLFVVTSSLFMVVYELLHLSYHLPADTFIGRQPLVHWLRRHHARHHDPRLMQRWNFNVTFPVFDYLMGTVAPEGDAKDIARLRPRRTPRLHERKSP